ncbi:hypothetical protein [Paraburkholderia youngii]|uniref:hypothetical protein n=1 Tax=Paraburkholderia youngii TaxID=2782701 RepID=UPI003D1A0859
MASRNQALASVLPPSEIGRFLSKRFWFRPVEPFKTTDFAADVRISAFEAHETLEHYAREGLMSYAGLEEGIETWAPSRDGLGVFGVGYQQAVRLKKRQVEALRESLEAAIGHVSSFGALELSVGGRPAFGKRNGRYLVGVRLDHTPYTREEDGRLHATLHDALSRPGETPSFSILLFSDKVPYRLKQREIVFGPRQGEVVDTPAARLDTDEKAYTLSFDAFLRSQGVEDGIEHFRDRGPHLEFSTFARELAREAQAMFAPARCAHSPHLLKGDVADVLSDRGAIASQTHRVAKAVSELRPEQAALLAEAEYFASKGEIEVWCESLSDHDWAVLTRYGFRAVPATNSTVIEMLLELAALRQQSKERKAQVKANRPPKDVRYYAVFDNLNFAGPHLVGYVRQPSSNAAAFRAIEQYWELVLIKIPDSIGAQLYKARFDGAYLSLAVEPAHEDEIAAFDQICKQAGKTFKFVAVQGDRALAVRSKWSLFPEDLGEVPAAMRAREPSSPFLPKLLIGARSSGLFDAIKTMTRAQQKAIGNVLVNSDDVVMLDFARNAAQVHCTDPAVLASGFRDGWRFAVNGRRWSATINAEDWEVELSSNTVNSLRIEVQIAGAKHVQQMAPMKADERRGYHQPYRGRLSSLKVFMERIQRMSVHGAAGYFEPEFRKEWLVMEPESRLNYFVDVLSTLLHGSMLSIDSIFESDGTSWPELQVLESAESR